MCDILIINTENDAFLNECGKNMANSFRGCIISNNLLNAAQEVYSDKPPKAVLIDVDRIDNKQVISFVKNYIKYAVALTDNYRDKDFVKNLYRLGFSDVRPKDHVNSLKIALSTVVKKRENTAIKPIEFNEKCFN